jgi:hypothetical protein
MIKTITMDPITLKLIQLLIVTIIGAVAVIFGFILFLRGLTGKSTVIVESKALKGKIANASPGVFLLIVGALAIYWSVSKDISKQEKSKDTVTETTSSIESWLLNSEKIKSDEGYTEMINQLIPKGDFVAKNLIIKRLMTLEEIADSVYEDKKYWKLLAVINKDRGYYKAEKATRETAIAKDNLVEYFVPTKFEHVRDRETLIKVRGNDMKAIYVILEKYADTAKHVQDIESLRTIEKYVKDNYELSVVYKFESGDGSTTLNELAMKYYGDKKFIGVITGFNPAVLKGQDPTQPIKKGLDFTIPYLSQ